ncbi:MAG: hypothetical protein V1735_06100 [Nanoarchaeota archaeon]
MATLAEICTRIGEENENDKVSITLNSRRNVTKALLVKILGMIPDEGTTPQALSERFTQDDSPFFDESIMTLLLGCTFRQLGLVEEIPPSSCHYVLTDYARQADYAFMPRADGQR